VGLIARTLANNLRRFAANAGAPPPSWSTTSHASERTELDDTKLDRNLQTSWSGVQRYLLTCTYLRGRGHPDPLSSAREAGSRLTLPNVFRSVGWRALILTSRRACGIRIRGFQSL